MRMGPDRKTPRRDRGAPPPPPNNMCYPQLKTLLVSPAIIGRYRLPGGVLYLKQALL